MYNGENNKSNIVIAIRLRPLLSYEKNISNIKAITTYDNSTLRLLMPVNFNPYESKKYINFENVKIKQYKYNFDYTFNEDITQEQIYNFTAKNFISNILNGFNSTIISYGGTGTGKTYTMIGNGKEPGIIIRIINDLFHEFQNENLDSLYQIQMSYFEIYNEIIYDLLNNKNNFIEVLNDPQKGFIISGITKKRINNPIEAYKILIQGNRNRKEGINSFNKNSSRSHVILKIQIVKKSINNYINLSNSVINYSEQTEFGELILVDLAGAEKDKKFTKNSEGYYINKSLFILSNCMNSLVNMKNTNFIHWRDSKLTKILKNYLSGNSKIVMIANISPSIISIKDTLFTIQFCESVKGMKVNAKKNIIFEPVHISKYDKIIKELKLQIANVKEEINIKNEEILNKSNSKSNSSYIIDNEEDEKINEISNHFKKEVKICQKIIQFEKMNSVQKLELFQLKNKSYQNQDEINEYEKVIIDNNNHLQKLYNDRNLLITNRKTLQDYIINSTDEITKNKLLTVYNYYISYLENLNSEFRAFISENDLKRKNEEISTLENQITLRDNLIKKVEEKLNIKYNMRLNQKHKKYMSVDYLKLDPCLKTINKSQNISCNSIGKGNLLNIKKKLNAPISQRNPVIILPLLRKNVSNSREKFKDSEKISKNKSAINLMRNNKIQLKQNSISNVYKKKLNSNIMEMIEKNYKKKVKTIIRKNILGRLDNSPYIREDYY